MWLLLLSVVYVILIILSYILVKKDMIRDKKKWTDNYKWTNGDRISALGISLLGPIALFLGISFFIEYLLYEKYKNYLDKPSKW